MQHKIVNNVQLMQGRRKQIKSGGAQFRREAPEKIFFWAPHFSSGPPHFGAKILTVCVIADSGH